MTKLEIFTPPKNIAVIGLSDNPSRPSYDVALYLKEQGFKIFPINPMIKEVFGQVVYPSLSALPNPNAIDIVDVFRQPEAVMTIVEEIITLKIKPVLWLQEGVVAPEAKTFAEENGLIVIMDECMKKEHYKISQQKT